MSLLINDVSTTGSTSVNPPSYVETYWPAEGDVITTRQSRQNGTIVLDPQGDLNEVTLIWPPDNVSQVGQIRRIAVVSGSIANLVIPDTTIYNQTTAMMNSDFPEYQKIMASTWMRII